MATKNLKTSHQNDFHSLWYEKYKDFITPNLRDWKPYFNARTTQHHPRIGNLSLSCGWQLFAIQRNYLLLKFFYKSKTLHTRNMWCSQSVCNFTAHARLCTVVLAILLYFTPLFNPSVCSPLNHTAKRVSTIPTTIFLATILCSCFHIPPDYIFNTKHKHLSTPFLIKSNVNW
jgi:hypothetical protein